nr:hypothetical protein [Tanacetum cinerariifolium]
MLVLAAEEVGQAQDDVSIPTEPSTSKPHKKHKSKKQQPKAPMVPSSESSLEHTMPSPSNDPIPNADNDILKFQELMDLCTRLSNKVLDLESEVIDIKSSFTEKIEKLEDRVHKLEEENRILKEKSFKSAKIDTAAPVPVVDYQIHHENNNPYYKIIRADGSHKLFLSFITLLKNFNREDLETLWKLVKERFETTEPKNFSYDFLLNILKIMFKKPVIKANVWKDQKGRYGLAKVKGWNLFESCRVHIITFITTQMFLLVEKKYPLTHFTLQQMLNNIKLEVEEENEMSLELLRLVRRQLNEGYVPE